MMKDGQVDGRMVLEFSKFINQYRGPGNAIKTQAIYYDYEVGKFTTDCKVDERPFPKRCVRTLVNHARQYGFPIIGCSFGYYMAETQAAVHNMETRLRGMAEELTKVADSLMKIRIDEYWESRRDWK